MPLPSPPPLPVEPDKLVIKGAREHNLQNIDLELPKKRLIVFTGVSGSGKSSLAFDTIFAEGQRRYVESLSAYARQFIGQMEKPRYDTIRGLAPTIAIDQKAAMRNPRSTVGTITEIHDYLRVLYARVGEQFCIHCGRPVGHDDAQGMAARIRALSVGTRLLLLAPLVEHRKGGHRDLLEQLRRQGFARVRVDGAVQAIEDIPALAKNKPHTIEAVVDRLVVRDDSAFAARLIDSVEMALKLGRGRLIVQPTAGPALVMNEARTCCGVAYPELTPAFFSFNAPQGMCQACNGIGTQLTMDVEKLIPDQSLSIRQGAVVPLRSLFNRANGAERPTWGGRQLAALSEQLGLDLDQPWRKLPSKTRDLLLYGAGGRELTVHWDSAKIHGDIRMAWEGLIPTLLRRFRQTQSAGQKEYYAGFMSTQPCAVCRGQRLRPEAAAVRIGKRSIIDLSAMTIDAAHAFVTGLELAGNARLIAAELLKEIGNRMRFLINVGLSYLTLERSGPTLSGGEAQRIRLASQVGSELTGVLYVLDEPSIGLHPRDNHKLLETLQHLRDIGNTLIVIEHDRATMEAADWIVDLGPGAGVLGGRVVAQGTPAQICADPASLTGRFLCGRETISPPPSRRSPTAKWLTVRDATANNLRNLTVKLPLGLLVAVTGVSGAGKSTLVNHILYPALANRLQRAELPVGAHGDLEGLSALDKVINIDQQAIGRTPRSNPATYTKVFNLIRDLFALLPEARARGYAKGRFSFNVKGGRCEACQGDGYIKVAMHFLPDVFVPCETCRGRRFNEATLQVHYKGLSIADVLDLSVRQARELFKNQPAIRQIMTTLEEVGLDYIKLGQSATTLSGGEAQRIKLARELAKRSTGRTLYILDEPTTGLHFADIRLLLNVLQRLVAGGNTVVVIEHNLDVIRSADWIIDLGPEGGAAGGRLVAEGPPEVLAQHAQSHTGAFLRRNL